MIYCISKKLEISAAHSLQLSYESKCSRMHGHNWQLEIFLVSRDKLACYKVNIQESFGNTATVIDENKIKGIEFIIK